MSIYDRAEAAGHPSSPVHATLPAPRFDHLRALTDRVGLRELTPSYVDRSLNLFSTDDNSRALVVVSRQTAVSGGLADLAATYIGFVLEARTDSGGFHNLRTGDGLWHDDVGNDESQGQAWWGLGTAATSAPSQWMREAGAAAFATCTTFDSPFLGANSYAALGAVEFLKSQPSHPAARALLERTSRVLADAAHMNIPWPEGRVTTDHARIPDALMGAGTALRDRRLISTGLRLLDWLVDAETTGNHFSFTPVAGRWTSEPRTGMDQHPLAAWAMADACHRAWAITGDGLWRVRAMRAARWLMGLNDTGATLYDRDSGATSDGLRRGSTAGHHTGESTLAGLGTLQVAVVCDRKPGQPDSP